MFNDKNSKFDRRKNTTHQLKNGYNHRVSPMAKKHKTLVTLSDDFSSYSVLLLLPYYFMLLLSLNPFNLYFNTLLIRTLYRRIFNKKLNCISCNWFAVTYYYSSAVFNAKCELNGVRLSFL